MCHRTFLWVVTFLAMVSLLEVVPVAAVADEAEKCPELDPAGDPRPDPSLEKTAAEEISQVQRTFRIIYHATADYAKKAEALSALFDEKAVFAGTLPPDWLEGRARIQQLWRLYFHLYRCPQIVFWSSKLRELSHNPHLRVIGQNVVATMLMPDRSGRAKYVNMRLSIIWVRVESNKEYDNPIDKLLGQRAPKLYWRIAHMHGSDTPPSRY